MNVLPSLLLLSTFEFLRIYVRVNKKSVHIIKCRFTIACIVQIVWHNTKLCVLLCIYISCLATPLVLLFSFNGSFSVTLTLSLSLFSLSHAVNCISRSTSLFIGYLLFVPVPPFSYVFCLFPALSLSSLSQSIFLVPSYHPYVLKFCDYLLAVTITISNLSAFAVSIRPYVN